MEPENKTVQVNIQLRDEYVEILKSVAKAYKIELKDIIEALLLKCVKKNAETDFINTIYRIKEKRKYHGTYLINIWLEIDLEFAEALNKLDDTNNKTPKRLIEKVCNGFVEYMVYLMKNNNY